MAGRKEGNKSPVKREVHPFRMDNAKFQLLSDLAILLQVSHGELVEEAIDMLMAKYRKIPNVCSRRPETKSPRPEVSAMGKSATTVRKVTGVTFHTFKPAEYENNLAFGTLIDLEVAEGVKVRFTVGRSGWFRHEGWIYCAGEVRLANSKRFWAILTICEQDSGEFYGALVPHKGELRDQQDGFVGFLAETEADIFPYKYRYYATISGDIHVGHDGWSN